MREILFRGKRIDNGEWVEGMYYKTKMSGAFILVPFNEVRKGANVRAGDDFDVYQVDPKTVGQYAGSWDKNCKSIFEGDICRVGNFNYKVEFKYSAWQFAILSRGVWCNPYFDSHCGENCEVIGNIYDNRDLVEENNG